MRMKLEFLSRGSRERPLIRMYEFSRGEVCFLRQTLYDLSKGSRISVPLHSEPSIERVGSCELTLRLGSWDQGIREISPSVFECMLTKSGWDNMAGLLDPFCERDVIGYQWLSSVGGTDLLLSPDGQW